MVKSELYSNLRDVVELLYDSLLPEGSNAVSCRDSEEELNLLQEEISALDYSCLDEIYHAGPEEVVNDDLSPIENALISSVGLLDRLYLDASLKPKRRGDCNVGIFPYGKRCTVHGKPDGNLRSEPVC